VGPVDRGLLPPGYSLVNEPGGAPTLIRTPPDVHLRNTGAVTPERVQAARDKLSDDIDAKQNDLQNYCGQYANDWATRMSSDPPLPDTQKWPQRINDLAATIQAAKQLRADLDFRLGNTTE